MKLVMTKNKPYFFADILGIVLVLFMLLPGSSLAQTTTHTVQQGETLYKIADQYNVEVEQLEAWNDINANELSVGTELVIRQTSSSNQSQDENAVLHTVKDNETLFSISKQYNVTIAELKSWNNLESNNLNIGQELTIYPSESSEDGEQSITTEEDTQTNTYYTVKNNDSLFKIARDHEMTVDQLKELNNLSSNTIRVGQQLTVRATSSTPSVSSAASSSAQGQFINHRISGSTSISELIEEFEMDEEEFRALNPDITSSTLRSGQEVTVLAPPSKTFENPYAKNSSSMENLGSISVSPYEQKAKATPTTSGELYNPDALTGAHSNIALGSVIFVENPDYPHGIFVRINDRITGNGLKLSSAAWNVLNYSGSSGSATIFQN
ncbi:endolytic peptidoglycan transglycosylase RlpA [Fodinibius salicampi]